MSGRIKQMKDFFGEDIYPISAKSASNYCKQADGTLICWGELVIGKLDKNGRSISVLNKDSDKYRTLNDGVRSVLGYNKLIFNRDKFVGTPETFYAYFNPIIFPVRFASSPQLFVTNDYHSSCWFTKVNWDNDEIISIEALTDQSTSPMTVGGIHWIAVGRWK